MKIEKRRRRKRQQRPTKNNCFDTFLGNNKNGLIYISLFIGNDEGA